MANQAALASQNNEFSLSNYSNQANNQANRRLPAESLPTTVTVVFSSRVQSLFSQLAYKICIFPVELLQ